jgi:hypothetical protein
MSEVVFLPCGGGLGDVIMTYLADPISHIEDGEGCFPSSNHVTSIWLRRLLDFKSIFPDVRTRVIYKGHNPAAGELFNTHPCIDEVDLWPWTVPQEGDGFMWDKKYKGALHINKCYRYEDFDVSDPEVYLTQTENVIVDKIVSKGDYVVIHPFAPWPRQVFRAIQYNKVVARLIESGVNVVIVGGSYIRSLEYNIDEEKEEHIDSWSGFTKAGVINLVNRVSARVSIALCMKAAGFIGTHSCMILAAWYKRVQSVLLLPGEGFGWSLEVQNPVSRWGIGKSFNEVIWVEPDTILDDEFANRMVEALGYGSVISV